MNLSENTGQKVSSVLTVTLYHSNALALNFGIVFLLFYLFAHSRPRLSLSVQLWELRWIISGFVFVSILAENGGRFSSYLSGPGNSRGYPEFLFSVLLDQSSSSFSWEDGCGVYMQVLISHSVLMSHCPDSHFSQGDFSYGIYFIDCFTENMLRSGW